MGVRVCTMDNKLGLNVMSPRTTHPITTTTDVTLKFKSIRLDMFNTFNVKLQFLYFFINYIYYNNYNKYIYIPNNYY